MTYLLDTHTFLWQIKEPEILPKRVHAVLRDRSATMLISLVTPWEIAIKVATGKLEASDILQEFETRVTRAHFTMLQTTVSQVVQSGALPLHHRDPFDRLLIAQALDLRIPILSSDSIFDLYGVQRIWA
jgi:PIN domain nuclease of toxin-antitoxin system